MDMVPPSGPSSLSVNLVPLTPGAGCGSAATHEAGAC
jgi:hypothetical protein